MKIDKEVEDLASLDTRLAIISSIMVLATQKSGFLESTTCLITREPGLNLARVGVGKCFGQPEESVSDPLSRHIPVHIWSQPVPCPLSLISCMS